MFHAVVSVGNVIHDLVRTMADLMLGCAIAKL